MHVTPPPDRPPKLPWDWGVVALAAVVIAVLVLLTMEFWLPHGPGH
jgi:hypothetical protein